MRWEGCFVYITNCRGLCRKTPSSTFRLHASTHACCHCCSKELRPAVLQPAGREEGGSAVTSSAISSEGWHRTTGRAHIAAHGCGLHAAAGHARLRGSGTAGTRHAQVRPPPSLQQHTQAAHRAGCAERPADIGFRGLWTAGRRGLSTARTREAVGEHGRVGGAARSQRDEARRRVSEEARRQFIEGKSKGKDR